MKYLILVLTICLFGCGSAVRNNINYACIDYEKDMGEWVLRCEALGAKDCMLKAKEIFCKKLINEGDNVQKTTR